MIDIGLSKLMIIGVVALVVIGPEKLPRVARTVGNLLGRAQRYVNDVKSEVSRQMELEELGKMKSAVESAASDVQSSINKGFGDVTHDLENSYASSSDPALGSTSGTGDLAVGNTVSGDLASAGYTYRSPRKNWRLKRAAVPQWYKRRTGVRGHVQSTAARRARHHPGR